MPQRRPWIHALTAFSTGLLLLSTGCAQGALEPITASPIEDPGTLEHVVLRVTWGFWKELVIEPAAGSDQPKWGLRVNQTALESLRASTNLSVPRVHLYAQTVGIDETASLKASNPDVVPFDPALGKLVFRKIQQNSQGGSAKTTTAEWSSFVGGEVSGYDYLDFEVVWQLPGNGGDRILFTFQGNSEVAHLQFTLEELLRAVRVAKGLPAVVPDDGVPLPSAELETAIQEASSDNYLDAEEVEGMLAQAEKGGIDAGRVELVHHLYTGSTPVLWEQGANPPASLVAGSGATWLLRAFVEKHIDLLFPNGESWIYEVDRAIAGTVPLVAPDPDAQHRLEFATAWSPDFNVPGGSVLTTHGDYSFSVWIGNNTVFVNHDNHFYDLEFAAGEELRAGETYRGGVDIAVGSYDMVGIQANRFTVHELERHADSGKLHRVVLSWIVHCSGTNGGLCPGHLAWDDDHVGHEITISDELLDGRQWIACQSSWGMSGPYHGVAGTRFMARVLGGEGQVSLYVKSALHAPSNPLTEYDCRSVNPGTDQECTITVPDPALPVWVTHECGAPGEGYVLPAYIPEITWTPSR